MTAKESNIIRNKILAKLKKRDMSIYALGVAMHEKKLMSREMVHKYLSGRNDISTARASEIMKYLKLY